MTDEQMLQYLKEAHAQKVILLGREPSKYATVFSLVTEYIETLEAKLAKAVEALDEAVYLFKPDEKDMMRQAGVYRIVTTLRELKGE